MIDIPNIIILMQHGILHEKLQFGVHIQDIKSYMGEPDRFIGNDEVGYWHYGFLRFGYFDGIVDQIAIFFERGQSVKFETKLKNIDGEIDFIETGTRLHQIIKLFNLHGIEWSGAFKKNELDYVTISIKDGADVTFDLDNGEIYRIAFRPADNYSQRQTLQRSECI